MIGSGSFGAVLTANYRNKIVVVKKLLGESGMERKRFIKEARFIQGLNSAHIVQFLSFSSEPLAIMMEYLYFDLQPFGIPRKVSSLKDLLLVIHKNFQFRQFEKLPLVAAMEIAAGMLYLHNLGIAHRDLKTLNVIVSNKHYASLTDEKQIESEWGKCPIRCKLIDFGESRSASLQTNTILNTYTKNQERGTIMYMAPELFEKDSKQVCNQSFMRRADIWSLGIIFHSLLSPDLENPYQVDIDDAGSETWLPLVQEKLKNKERPTSSGQYQHLQMSLWKPIENARNACLVFEPTERCKVKDIPIMLEGVDSSDRSSTQKRVGQKQKTDKFVEVVGTVEPTWKMKSYFSKLPPNQQEMPKMSQLIIPSSFATESGRLSQPRKSGGSDTEFQEEKEDRNEHEEFPYNNFTKPDHLVEGSNFDLFSTACRMDKVLADEQCKISVDCNQSVCSVQIISKQKRVSCSAESSNFPQALEKVEQTDLSMAIHEDVSHVEYPERNIETEEIDVDVTGNEQSHVRDVDLDPSAEPLVFSDDYPVLCTGLKERITAKSAAQVLLNPQLNPNLICQSVPRRTQRNFAFVINLNALDNPNDVTADDNGATRSGQGRKSHVYCKLEEDKVVSLRIATVETEKQTGEDHFILSKYNSTFESSRDFHRCIMRLETENGSEKYFQYCIVQYFFDRDEHPFNVTAHRNAKKTTAPYKQTAKSVREHLSTALLNKKPKEALYEVSSSVGGRLAAKSSSSLPRNYKQAVNMRSAMKSQQSFCGTKDVLAELMEQCKKTMNCPSKAFIWKVEAAPEPMCIIAYKNAFSGMARACITGPQGQHSVLTVDPTFNLGEFSFTPTSFNSKSVHKRSSGEDLIFMGPSLIHYRKKFSTYHYFTTSLVGIEPKLHTLRCFGTDGEENLMRACEKTWPFADGLRCKLHSKRNCQSHLSSYLPDSVVKLFITDIYGERRDSHYEEGLCDLDDADTFEATLSSLQDTWNEREKEHRGSSCSLPLFHVWFQDRIAPYMRASMLKDVRERNGLMTSFTTNNSESLNAAIKRKAEYKASELPDFLRLMKELYDNQDEVVRSAFSGDGDYELKDNLKEFDLGDRYYALTTQKRILHEQRFYAKTADAITEPKAVLKKVYIQGDNIQQIPGLPASHSFNLTTKASKIIENGLIIPSFTTGCYHVTGSAGEHPHFVKRVAEGDFRCDPDDPRLGCISFKKNKICSHVVAASKVHGEFAALVAKHTCRKNVQPNITELGNHAIPTGAGEKPGQKRKRAPKQAVETISKARDVFQLPCPVKIRIMQRNGKNIAINKKRKEYDLEFLADHPQVNVCAGCRDKFPRMKNGSPYPPPDDIVVSHWEKGSKRLPSGVLKVFGKESKRYYHPNIACVRNGNRGLNKSFSGSDVGYETILVNLTAEHREAMRRNLDIDIQ